jgi:hypothetical protein
MSVAAMVPYPTPARLRPLDAIVQDTMKFATRRSSSSGSRRFDRDAPCTRASFCVLASRYKRSQRANRPAISELRFGGRPLKALIILSAYGSFQHVVSHSMRGEASNPPKDRSPHHHVIYAQRTRNQWGQSGSSSDLRPTTSAASRKKRFGTRRASSPVAPSKEYFGGCMAKIIEFYIPPSFRKVSKWLPANERGKLLEFPVAVRKSA